MLLPNAKNLNFVLLLFLFFSGFLGAQPQQVDELILANGTLLNPEQKPITGHLWIKKGKIFKIGSFPLPKEVPIFEATGLYLLPGFVDANFRAGRVADEGSAEVVPHLNLIAGIFPDQPAFAKALKEGVTTVAISSTEEPVIGARSCILKTAPEISILKESADLKITIGAGPINRDPKGSFETFYTRRPFSRLGLFSVIQQAVHQAESGKDETLKVLLEVKKGNVPLRINANLKRDIRSALMLAQKWGVPFLLEGGVESYHYFKELKKQKAGILYAPPFDLPPLRFDSGWREEQQTPMFLFPQLCIAADVPLAITSTNRNSLQESSSICTRFGLSQEELLKAITLEPARLLGISDRVGSLAIGKDADIVILQGKPFQLTSSIKAVLVQGQILYQKK